MANRISVISGKGGVGKTTLSAGIAQAFANMGRKTLLIDCDAGLPGLDILLECGERVNFTWYDVYKGNAEPQEAVITLSDMLSLVPAPKIAPQEDCSEAVKTVSDALEEEYDIIIADAPAGLGRGLIRALCATENALIAATADEISVKGAESVDKTARENGIKQTRLLINKYNLKNAGKGKLLTIDEIIDKTAVQLIGIVPEDRDIAFTTVYKRRLRTEKSKRAFERIARRINGENVLLSLSQLK